MTSSDISDAESAKHLLGLAKAVQASLPGGAVPPDEGGAAASQQVIPNSVVRGTRGYIEKVANQVNGCYERGWFDSCAVMIRRLIETLIIEAFEHHQISENIKGPTGDFLYLRDLVGKTVAETTWNLSRNTKKALPRLKDIGDKSAHSRRYVAHRKDVDKVIDDVRMVTQELVYLAGLK